MSTDYFIGLRFRAAHDYAYRNGYYTAFPNFHQARYPNPDRIVYGTFLLRDAVVDWRDVPATEYRATNVRTRFTGAHDYALRVGYQHGFPNWHEAEYGAGVVYGTLLIPHGTLQWRDVPAAELGLGTGDPTRYGMDYWFRGASDYAYRNGFAAAMPNGHYATIGGRWVCGVFLFPAGTAEWRDVRGRDLRLTDIYPPKPPPLPTPKVKVPNLRELGYDDAKRTVEQAGLRFSPTYPLNFPIFGGDKNLLFVNGQGPVAGAEADQGSWVTVIFAMRESPAVGVALVRLTNRHQNGRLIAVHVWKQATGRWTDLGVLDFGQTADIAMEEGVAARVVAVDTGLINCPGNDPNNVSCQRWSQDFMGDAEGLVVPFTVF